MDEFINMKKKNIIKFLETPKTKEEIEKEFGKQKEIDEILNKLYKSGKIRCDDSTGVSYYEKTDHDFILYTVRIIAQSASYICSNPECRNLTIAGSKALVGRVINIGEAAHIIGNAKGSARYEEKTIVNKSSVENGIWLCRNCHKLVDSNGGKDYPTEKLKQWKIEHNKYLSKNLGKPVNLSTDNLKTAQSFNSWSKNPDIESPRIFIRDPERDLIMQKIKEIININNQTTQIIRLSGLSGLGKTRLIYESLKSSNLSEKIYYYANGSRFLGSAIYTMLQNNAPLNLILVIDDCTIDNQQKIKKNFSLKTNKITIITIGFHNEEHINDDNYFQLEFMDPALIEEILKENFKKIPKKIRKNIINASHCFPKFALRFISAYFQGNMNYIASDYDINRLIFGEKTNLNEGVKKKILIHIALFLRLGFAGKIRDEYFETSEIIGYPLGKLNDESYKESLISQSEWVCSLIELNWTDYAREIDDLNKKGIIRGEFRIDILPIPLTYFLINEWWSQNSNPIKIIANIPKKTTNYLADQFFFSMNVFCVLKEGSKSYKNIMEFMKDLEEKGLYLDKILNFIIDRYYEINPSDREILLQKLINREDFIIKFLRYILTPYHTSLRLRDNSKLIRKIINRLSIEEISQTLNEWPVYISNKKSKIILIDEFQKLIKDKNWKNSILQTLYTYYDFLTDQLKLQFINRLEKEAEYISYLIATTGNKPSEDSLIFICEKLLNTTENNTKLLNILAFIQDTSLIKLRKYLLLELSKNEGCVKYFLLFITRNQDILDENIVKKLVKNTNKFTSSAGKAFQNHLSIFLNQEKFKKTIPIVKTYEETKDIKQAKESIHDIIKNILQLEFSNFQNNLPNFKTLSENYIPNEMQYLIISLNVSKRIENKFYDFYNIFLKYDFFYFINSIIFPSARFYETSKQRESILKDFEMNGFYLVDFNLLPTTYNYEKEEILSFYEISFKSKLEKLISKGIPVIIIDENLYQVLNENLKKDGFNIVHKQPIPKPNDTNYNRFKDLFRSALIAAGYKPQ